MVISPAPVLESAVPTTRLDVLDVPLRSIAPVVVIALGNVLAPVP